jgi:hypothetical protein
MIKIFKEKQIFLPEVVKVFQHHLLRRLFFSIVKDYISVVPFLGFLKPRISH